MLASRGSIHDGKFAEWAKRVYECSQSGKSVAQWCREKGIRSDHYYYWRKRMHRMAKILRDMPVDTEEPGIFPIGESAVAIPSSSGSIPGLVRVSLRGPSAATPADDGAAPLPASAEPAAAVTVHIGQAYCEIRNGADAGAIERTLLALKKIC